jgi:hypothetical protein
MSDSETADLQKLAAKRFEDVSEAELEMLGQVAKPVGSKVVPSSDIATSNAAKVNK